VVARCFASELLEVVHTLVYLSREEAAISPDVALFLAIGWGSANIAQR
jgi:hypothetical protein